MSKSSRIGGKLQSVWRVPTFLLAGLALILCAQSSAAARQDQSDSGVRGIFIESRPTKTPPPSGKVKPSTHVGSAQLGFGYTLFLDDPAGPKRADPQTVFHSGDGVRLLIETNRDAYLYVFHQEGSEPATLLYPAQQLRSGENRVGAHQPSFIPGSAWFQFDNNPGEEKLTLIVSEKPLPGVPRGAGLTASGYQLTTEQLDHLIATAQPSSEAGSSDEGKPISAAEGTRGLILTETDPAPSKIVMTKTKTAGPGWVVARLSLTHR
ncbi:MAG: DUF4384 domain-containing protein [Candidatus Acidiferrales bacterium]